MSDSVLKKEFQKRDVERLRNLVAGKHGNRTTVGIGYNGPQEEEHKEGDIWEQGGRTWTIKDGIKENVTKLDKFKKVAVPLFCPNCKQVMDKQLDTCDNFNAPITAGAAKPCECRTCHIRSN